MNLIPLLIQQGPVNFSGGLPEKLVRTMAAHGVTPVAIFADPNVRIKSLIGYRKQELTPKLVARETGLLAYGTSLGFSSRELPGGFLVTRADSGYRKSVGPVATVTAAKGRITVGANGSCWLRVADLMTLDLEHPLRSHWTYRAAYVAVTPGTFPESLLIQTVGDALGAKVRIDGKDVRYDFDAAKHRGRATALYQDRDWSPEGDIMFRWNRKIYDAGVSLVTDDQWSKAYEAPDSELTLDKIPANSALVRGAREGLLEMCRYLYDTGQKQSYEVTSAEVEEIDPKATARITVRANGTIWAGVVLKGGRHWINFG